MEPMSLSAEDLAAIGAVVDGKLAAARDEDRRRRRFWWIFWIAVFVLSSVASILVARHYLAEFQRELSAREAAFQEAKIAYQEALLRNRELQEERKRAAEAVQYRSGKSQAEYEAGLISGMLGMISQSVEISKRMDALDPDDPQALIDATQDIEHVTQGIMGMLGEMMLRNTDPAHNSPEENLMLGETAEPMVEAPTQDIPQDP